ncbi:hypothetical protein HYH02_007554 [Chlamydomonas schloesseri]|uniref:Tbc2 translation factor, chloroplastic n=1 Tax=Chlamydomonas schloesseri TaxID=2026947 RepID=A0A836B4Q1_9CHLO|nr:hypothetical protein HYH02_007554 [Chlamydomonas schloesseri]|eukprot:KAG2447636.1 hypothetical protein HYH02_007554 [Chlamydomonas schloesseri]
MSAWLRPVASEPLCAPSTSYSTPSVSYCRTRLAPRRARKCLQQIRCQATQSLQSYHNAYKLIHQPSRKADSGQPAEGQAEAPPAGEPPHAASPGEAKGRGRRAGKSKDAASAAAVANGASGVNGANGAHASSGSHPVASPTGPDALVSFLTSPDFSAAADASVAASASPSDHQQRQQQRHRQRQRQQQRVQITTTGAYGSEPSSTSPPSPADAGGTGDADMRPYTRHSVALPAWQPPPSSLQARTALTRAISTCPTYTRLHQLLLDNAPDFNVYHSCAALSRVLALHRRGLSPRESRLFKEGCSMLQSVLRRQLTELHPRAVVVAAYSLARLELPDRELLAGLAAAVEPQLPALQPRGLSSLLWAFARQGHQPPPKWMDSFLSCCAAELPRFAPRDVSTLLWGLARLHYKVAPARLRQLLEHSQAQLGAFCGRSLSNVVYSLALSQQHPGEEWLAAAQARAVALGPGAFSPQGLTQMAWGLAKLGSPPSPALLDMVCAHAAARLPRSAEERRQLLQLAALRDRSGFSSASDSEEEEALAAAPPHQQAGSGSGKRGSRKQQQQQARAPRRPLAPYSGLDLSTLMYALGSWGAQPRPEVGRRLLLALEWELPRLEPNQLCNCVWACARLRLYPSRSWLRDFYDASYRQLPYFKPVDLSQSLWALARLGAAAPEAWLGSALVRLQHTASMFSPVEVANTMWALAKMGVRGERLPAEVLALFFIATDRRLSSFKPQELCSMVWALAHMRRRPDKEWTAEFLKVTYHKLGGMSGWCLATMAWSLAELQLSPPPAWTYAYVNAARALLPEAATAAPAAPTASALQQPGAEPPLRSVRELAAASASSSAASPASAVAGAAASDSGSGLSAIDLGQIITGLRRLNAAQGLAKVDDFIAEAEGRLRALEAGSGAYATQQVGHFLAMSRRQAGLRPAALGGRQQQHEQHGLQELDGAALAHGVEDVDDEEEGAGVETRRRVSITGLADPDLSGSGSDAEELVAAGTVATGAGAVQRRGNTEASTSEAQQQQQQQQQPHRKRGRPSAAAAAVAAEPPAAAARDVLTRVLRTGARVTVLAPPPEVHLELGDLTVELPGATAAAVSLRSGGGATSSSTNNNGSGSNGVGSDGVSSAAEIKQRLMAV